MAETSNTSILLSAPMIVLYCLILVLCIALLVVFLMGKKKRNDFLDRRLLRLEAKMDENDFLNGKLNFMTKRLYRMTKAQEIETIPAGVEPAVFRATKESLQDLLGDLPEEAPLSVTQRVENGEVPANAETLLNVTAEKAAGADVPAEDEPVAAEVSEAVSSLVNEAVEELVAEEPAVETVEAVAEEVPAEPAVIAAEETATPAETADADGEEEEDSAFSSLVFIDPDKDPEAYANLLDQVSKGEVTLVTRVKKSYLANIILAEDNLQSYRNEIKNCFLKYKGISDRLSWNYEAFRCGQTAAAKMICKGKSLNLYLGLDPATLAAGKYTVIDVSAKKKYEATPSLIKIKGDRKFKYALELIDKLCTETLALSLKKTFTPEDETVPDMTLDALKDAGYVKILYAGAPVIKSEN